jgi:hypothetical protein
VGGGEAGVFALPRRDSASFIRAARNSLDPAMVFLDASRASGGISLEAARDSSILVGMIVCGTRLPLPPPPPAATSFTLVAACWMD